MTDREGRKRDRQTEEGQGETDRQRRVSDKKREWERERMLPKVRKRTIQIEREKDRGKKVRKDTETKK